MDIDSVRNRVVGKNVEGLGLPLQSGWVQLPRLVELSALQSSLVLLQPTMAQELAPHLRHVSPPLNLHLVYPLQVVRGLMISLL